MRTLQYRLRSQGMLELDAWLAPLLQAVSGRDDEVLQAVNHLLCLETPELLAMQAGSRPVPRVLEPWLKPR